MTAPALVVWFTQQSGWGFWKALIASLAIVIVFRGMADLLFRRIIPWPSLFGVDSEELREEDIVGRRRAWFWRFWLRLFVGFAAIITILWIPSRDQRSWVETIPWFFDKIGALLTNQQLWIQLVFVFFLFFANFAMLFGPLLLMNLSQMQSFEPGDAEWGVNLADVRGQVEAKGEVSRVVDIWQSGEQFERAGGKRERGLLLFGAPGTGKTMLAKAIATGFNSPFISMPGSGFAATFIGIDAIIVRILARKAKRLARKWGGQCIVFIDEIDAVGMRRQSLGTGAQIYLPVTSSFDFDDQPLFGPWGARNPSGDLIVETQVWRERLFAQRQTSSWAPSGFYARMAQITNWFMFPGGMGGGMGGGLALNQLLVVMDGIDNPPFFRRHITSTVNKTLDALYIVPRRIGKTAPARAGCPATERADLLHRRHQRPDRPARPALIRPGRMGRHVWFRTPTKDDRLDILDLYIGKVSHEPELDSPKRRDEIARIMSGYSPAMIEQAISMALTMAHHDGRVAFGWDDLVEALTTLDAGTAVGTEHVGIERRSVAIHEAGSRRRRAPLREGRRVGAPHDQEARRDRRPPLDDPEGRPDVRVPARDVRGRRPHARRDGCRARLLRREHERRRRRRPERHVGGRPGWSAARRWARSRSP